MSLKLAKTCTGGHFNRRDFLRVGSLGFLGIGLPQILRLQHALAAEESVRKAKAQACILIWLEGGQSQMDTWDPKPSSSFASISTNVPGIQISELFPTLAQRMDRIALIRSMHSKENNHLQATHFAVTGHSPSPAMKFPSFGSIITHEMGARNNVPPHLMVPEMDKRYNDTFRGHIIPPENDPMFVPKPSVDSPMGEDVLAAYDMPDLSVPVHLSPERIAGRRSFLTMVDQFYREKVEAAEFAKMDRFTEQAWNMITSPNAREAFDLSKESDKTRDAYGRDETGQSILLARRLVEAGSRFVTANAFTKVGWDTHDFNDKKLRESLGPQFDRTITALLDDLEERGLLESTVVLMMGEFGRTADVNVGQGRDHWPECWTVALAGGGIRGGQVVGASDERGAYVADRMVTIGDLYATLYKAFGIDWTKEYMHPIGRPIKIANSTGDKTGVPVHELV